MTRKNTRWAELLIFKTSKKFDNTFHFLFSAPSLCVFHTLRFTSVSRSHHWEKHNKKHGVEMEETVGNQDVSRKDANEEIQMEKTNNVKKVHKCNQCMLTSTYASHLKAHQKTHCGEKSNKCNQCDFTSSQAGHLREHLKTHSGEKSNKCNQCDFASSQAGDSRRHLKTHSGVKCYFASSRAGDLKRHLKTQWRKVKQM